MRVLPAAAILTSLGSTVPSPSLLCEFSVEPSTVEPGVAKMVVHARTSVGVVRQDKKKAIYAGIMSAQDEKIVEKLRWEMKGNGSNIMVQEQDGSNQTNLIFFIADSYLLIPLLSPTVHAHRAPPRLRFACISVSRPQGIFKRF